MVSKIYIFLKTVILILVILATACKKSDQNFISLKKLRNDRRDVGNY